MKRPLIIANWKLYIQSLDDARAAAKTLSRAAAALPADLVLCPPAPFIHEVAKAAGAHIKVGAQAVSRFSGEKNTGEIPAKAAASAGAQFSIVGHSERRAMGQSDAEAALEVEATLAAGLSPVLCVGEHERDQSGGHFSAIEAQLRASLPKLSPRDAKRLIVAYEPVWAIGKTAQDAMTPDDLEETAIYLRKVLAEVVGRAEALKIPILYGGSVESDNAGYLMHAGVAGFLVGHASVDPKSLIAIARAAGTHHGAKEH